MKRNGTQSKRAQEQLTPRCENRNNVRMNTTPAKLVIERFGGIRRLARSVGLSPSTVCRWQMGAGEIPRKRWAQVLEAAGSSGIELSLNEVVFGGISVAKNATPARDRACNSETTNSTSSPAPAILSPVISDL
jgi:hypothetical protein